jgi:hypothetical protein
MELIKYPKVTWIIATNNRAACLERVVRNFIDQDYKGEHSMWVYNNGKNPFLIDTPVLPDNKKILVSHYPVDIFTGQPYLNVGSIFNNIIFQLPRLESQLLGYKPDIISFGDDDDIYLPDHISEGVKGIKEAQKKGAKAYKPHFSYYRSTNKVELAHNNLEPSIFSLYDYIYTAKCLETAVSYHDGWINPLKDSGQFYVGAYPKHKPTLIYDWSSEIPVYKISGTGEDSPENFAAYNSWSKDYKNLITPIPEEKAKFYYNLVKGIK